MEKITISAEIQAQLICWIQSIILSLDSQHNLVAYTVEKEKETCLTLGFETTIYW